MFVCSRSANGPISGDNEKPDKFGPAEGILALDNTNPAALGLQTSVCLLST